jgi:penicillin amidase
METTMARRAWLIWGRRTLLLVLALLLLAALGAWLFLRASLAQLDGKVTSPLLTGSVTVTRDANGVPTISGANRLDLAYATGYVHAQERFFQMDLLRRSAAGELAELFGPKALPLDRGCTASAPTLSRRWRAWARSSACSSIATPPASTTA